MKYKIAITCPTFIDLSSVWNSAHSSGIELDVEDHSSCSSTAEYIEALKDADAAMVSTRPLTTREVMVKCSRLKAVSRMGVGVDSIDLDAATDIGVMVCNVPGENTGEVAEHAVALTLMVLRRLPQSIHGTRQGAWADDPIFVREMQTSVARVAGQTAGILGLGNIGKAFATRISAFGPRRILAYDKYVSQAQADLYGVEMVSLEQLLRESDFITIHAPHTPETDKIINADTLAMMKRSAVLVNCSRGGLVDQAALTETLKNGGIAFAALDVTEEEPISSDDELLRLRNAFITPHTAGFSSIFLRECGLKQADNLVRALTDRMPHGLANSNVIKRIAVMRSQDHKRWANVPERR